MNNSVTAPGFLSDLLRRADGADVDVHIWTADEIVDWPQGALEAFVSEGILRPTTPATAVVCDGCDDGHWETPAIVVAPVGSLQRAYIHCPIAGRVAVDLSRLRQWEFDLDAMAKCLARILEIGPVQEHVPERLWRLGTLPAGGERWAAFLTRGLGWSDGQDLANRARRTRAPLFLTLGGGIDRDLGVAAAPIALILSIHDGALSVSRTALEEYAASLDVRERRGGRADAPRDATPPPGRRSGAGVGAMLDCWMTCKKAVQRFDSKEAFYDAAHRYLIANPPSNGEVPERTRLPRLKDDARRARQKSGRDCSYQRHRAALPPDLIPD